MLRGTVERVSAKADNENEWKGKYRMTRGFDKYFPPELYTIFFKWRIDVYVIRQNKNMNSSIFTGFPMIDEDEVCFN